MEGVTELKDVLPNGYACQQIVHCEIHQKSRSTARSEDVKQAAEHFLRQQKACYSDTSYKEFTELFLSQNIECISLCADSGKVRGAVNLEQCNLIHHIYQLYDEGPAQEDLDEDEDIPAANHWILPATEFHGLWDSLIFDSNIKSQLLQYARTTLLFSDRKVDANIISWNRVILLHGPPGTGKTSLCKALAQKLCIHLSDRYRYGQLIEINSHSLFSKWFSESGKLVLKMFQKIQELIDDPEALVCVLIDEVESLTAARKASLSGSEPSDAIRVVNALLTQLDQIKKHSNVIILTTSNITGAIDLAFVDRADIKQYIGPPSPAAIYQIYYSCINELVRAGIVNGAHSLVDLRTLELMKSCPDTEVTGPSLKLKQAAIKSEGLSGRTLRKLPFIAHASFLQSSTVSLDSFLEALMMAICKQFEERSALEEAK